MENEELSKLMRNIVKAIDDAGVPDDLRVAAFEKAFEASVQPVAQSSSPNTGGPDLPQKTESPGPEEDRSIGAIARKLRVDHEVVDEIYFIDGEALGLAVSAARLDPAKSSATKQIALLIAAGRQTGGWEEWTHVGEIRNVARDYNRFDSANFATTIKSMSGAFGFRGRGRDVEVRVTRPGLEEAAELVRALGGE